MIYLDGTKVTNVSAINDIEVVIGDFTDVVANGTNFDVKNDKELAVVGNANEDSLSIIGRVSDGAVINDVGGAEYVITDTEGSFSFAGHKEPFVVAGDSYVVFEMVDGTAASVSGIANFAVDGEYFY